MSSYLWRVIWFVCLPFISSGLDKLLCLLACGPPSPPCTVGRDFKTKDNFFPAMKQISRSLLQAFPSPIEEHTGSHKPELLSAHACEILLFTCRSDKRRQTRRGRAKSFLGKKKRALEETELLHWGKVPEIY